MLIFLNYYYKVKSIVVVRFGTVLSPVSLHFKGLENDAEPIHNTFGSFGLVEVIGSFDVNS